MSDTLNSDDVIFIMKKSDLISLKLKKDDIAVFKKPVYVSSKGVSTVYIKRCIGLPGDTVFIEHAKRKGKEYAYRKSAEKRMFLYPYDTLFNKWSLSDYGPIWIPEKHSNIELDFYNYTLYKKIIESEGNTLEIIGNAIYLNNAPATEYNFKNNYYFMLGDNFYQSEDSRSWGVISENNIVGKMICKF